MFVSTMLFSTSYHIHGNKDMGRGEGMHSMHLWHLSASRLPQSFWHCLIVSCHLIPLPYSCPIQPMQSWGDKEDSANTLVLPHSRGGGGAISESRLSQSSTEMLCEVHGKLKTFLGCCLPFLWLVKIFWHNKSPFKNGVYIKIKYILLRKVPLCRFMRSQCENENIPTWGKCTAP